MHYTTLHYTTLHYATLHYTTQHTTVHYTALQYTTLIALHYTTLHHTTPHHTTLNYTTLQYPTPHCITLHYITLHLHYATLITPPQMQLQLHYTNYTTPQLQLHYTTTTAALHHTTSRLWVRWPTMWPLQPLQSLHKTQLQPPFGPSVDSLCHPWFTTTNLSYGVSYFWNFRHRLVRYYWYVTSPYWKVWTYIVNTYSTTCFLMFAHWGKHPRESTKVAISPPALGCNQPRISKFEKQWYTVTRKIDLKNKHVDSSTNVRRQCRT